MEVLDYSIIAFYFAIILWIAQWASKRKEDKEFSSVDYFLAGKDQSWIVIGASLFASNSSLPRLEISATLNSPSDL